ncbi:MAG: hypothetical protein QM831_31020 [Kofleriaceae bacterium]
MTILLIASCGGSSSDDDGNQTATGDLLGTVSVQLVAPHTESDGTMDAGYTSVLGKIYDGTVPDTVIWDTSMTDGGCVLSIPRVPFCSPSCSSTQACVDTNTCADYPTAQDVGTVHLDGVKTSSGSSFDLTSVSNTYQAAGLTLTYPGFAEGDTIKVSGSGSSFTPAFSTSAKGVAQLSIGNSSSLALAASTALNLSWTAPAVTGSSVHVKLDISHHGGSKGKIECDTDDTGSLTLSSGMVDKLLSLGAAGYPTIIVTRSSTGHAGVADGHVDLVVSSEIEEPITVPGVVSCTQDSDCTSPATCQDDLTCQ